MTANNPIQFWSFSALRNFEVCPYFMDLSRIQRQPGPYESEEDMPADHPLARGKRIHQEAEEYVNGTRAGFPPSLKKLRTEFEKLRLEYDEGRVWLEERMCFNRDWDPLEPEENRFVPQGTWHIQIPDAIVISRVVDGVVKEVRIIDYKTGKSWGKEVQYMQQVQLYALGALMRFPSVDTVKVEMWYIDEGAIKPKSKNVYTRAFVPAALEQWTRRGEALVNATAFPPKPNRGNCRFCDYGVENGTGACPYAIPYS